MLYPGDSNGSGSMWIDAGIVVGVVLLVFGPILALFSPNTEEDSG
jgi:hypothetical protein